MGHTFDKQKLNEMIDYAKGVFPDCIVFSEVFDWTTVYAIGIHHETRDYMTAIRVYTGRSVVKPDAKPIRYEEVECHMDMGDEDGPVEIIRRPVYASEDYYVPGFMSFDEFKREIDELRANYLKRFSMKGGSHDTTSTSDGSQAD